MKAGKIVIIASIAAVGLYVVYAVAKAAGNAAGAQAESSGESAFATNHPILAKILGVGQPSTENPVSIPSSTEDVSSGVFDGYL